MIKKILSMAAFIASFSMFETSCSKKADPTPSAPTETSNKLSATETSDLQASTGTVKKSTDARKKSTDVSSKLKQASGRIALSGFRTETDPGNNFDTTPGANMSFPGPGGMAGDNTFQPGQNFTVDGINQSEMDNINAELEKSIGGKVSFMIKKDTIIFSIDFNQGKAVIDMTGSGVHPIAISGKMTAKTIMNGAKSTNIMIFEKYAEKYSADNLSYSMDGTINDEIAFLPSGEFTSINKMNVAITSGKVLTKLITNLALTFAADGQKYTENGIFTITEATEIYNIKSENATYDFTCPSADGLPTGGKQTINIVSTKIARKQLGTETLTIDYGTGTCDGILIVKGANGNQTTFESKDLK